LSSSVAAGALDSKADRGILADPCKSLVWIVLATLAVEFG
jgi:hypothetical protein